MKTYPNFRNTVEVVILHDSKILIAKRSEDAVVAPGVWNVPAGKVKYEETPLEALYREAKEETNLEVELIKELGVRAFKGKSVEGEYYRCVFTYLVKPKNGELSSLIIDEEHSEHAWVDKTQLQDEKYNSFDDKLKQLLMDNIDF